MLNNVGAFKPSSVALSAKPLFSGKTEFTVQPAKPHSGTITIQDPGGNNKLEIQRQTLEEISIKGVLQGSGDEAGKKIILRLNHEKNSGEVKFDNGVHKAYFRSKGDMLQALELNAQQQATLETMLDSFQNYLKENPIWINDNDYRLGRKLFIHDQDSMSRVTFTEWSGLGIGNAKYDVDLYRPHPSDHFRFNYNPKTDEWKILEEGTEQKRLPFNTPMSWETLLQTIKLPEGDAASFLKLMDTFRSFLQEREKPAPSTSAVLPTLLPKKK